MTSKEPLYLRLWREPQLYELARFISYGGRREKDVKAKVEEMRVEHTGNKRMWAMVELTKKDEATGLTVLKPDVRKLCRGPARAGTGWSDVEVSYRLSRR